MKTLNLAGEVTAFAGSIDMDSYVLNTGSFQNTMCFAPDLRNNTGWILCDGSAFEPGLFPNLYAVIGDIYGTDSDTGMPLLPDYQGYFLRGVLPDSVSSPGGNVEYANDDRVSAQNGSKNGVGSTQKFILQEHEHKYTNYPYQGTVTASEGSPAGLSTANPTYTEEMVDPQDQAFPIQTNETRPSNIYVFYLISTGRQEVFPGTHPGPHPPRPSMP